MICMHCQTDDRNDGPQRNTCGNGELNQYDQCAAVGEVMRCPNCAIQFFASACPKCGWKPDKKETVSEAAKQLNTRRTKQNLQSRTDWWKVMAFIFFPFITGWFILFGKFSVSTKIAVSLFEGMIFFGTLLLWRNGIHDRIFSGLLCLLPCVAYWSYEVVKRCLRKE